MNVVLKGLLRVFVVVGGALLFIYLKFGFRAATQTQFDALNAERQAINMQYQEQPPPHSRTDM